MRFAPRKVLGCLVLFGCIGCAPLLAADTPDAAINTLSGRIEIADPVRTDGQCDVWHIAKLGPDKTPAIFVVSDDPQDDLDPRIVVDPDGDTWIVWWRAAATHEVLVRKRTYSDQSWSGERRVSTANESSRKPSVVHDGSTVWLAYELDDAGGKSIAVNSIIDEPDPIPTRTILGSTSYLGELDVRMHSDSSHLWVTWIDSDAWIGWSEYDTDIDAWTPAAFEPLSAGDTAAARTNIMNGIIGD